MSADVFRCPACDGRRKVHRYSDRPAPCAACGGRGELAYEWRKVDDVETECVEVGLQEDLFGEEAAA